MKGALIPTQRFDVHLTLTEAQARALHKLAPYAADQLVDTLAKVTSQDFDRGHAHHIPLVAFFAGLGKALDPSVKMMDAARAAAAQAMPEERERE